MTSPDHNAAEVGEQPEGPGRRLRAERERQSQSVEAIAKAMNVTPKVVVALEANDFASFDAPVFARGHLRKYGLHLGLAPDPIVSAYELVASGAEAPSLIPPMSLKAPARHWPTLLRPVLAVVASLVVLAAAAWLWWRGGVAPAGLVTPTPPTVSERPAAVSEAPEPVPAVVPDPQTQHVAPAPTAPRTR
jgi:cytoskeleton protein RodZ